MRGTLAVGIVSAPLTALVSLRVKQNVLFHDRFVLCVVNLALMFVLNLRNPAHARNLGLETAEGANIWILLPAGELLLFRCPL